MLFFKLSPLNQLFLFILLGGKKGKMRRKAPKGKGSGGKSLTRDELMKRAKAKGVKGRSKMNKAQLRKSLGMKPLKK